LEPKFSPEFQLPFSSTTFLSLRPARIAKLKRPSESRNAFDLESLEPRLLLSADGLSAGISASNQPTRSSIDLQAITVSDTTNWAGLHDSAAANVAGNAGTDLFADVADEALFSKPDAVIPVTISASIAPAGAAIPAPIETAPETISAPVSAQVSTQVSMSFAAVETAATTLGATSLTGQTDRLSDQLTTTLTSANGPPASVSTTALPQSFSANSSLQSTESALRARAASVSSVAESTLARAAATTAHTGDYTFASSGTTTVTISGSGAGQYDVVTVSGAATLGGTLAINVTGTPSLQVGDTLTLIIAGTTVTGSFADATGLFGFGDGTRYFALVQESGSVKLVVKQFPGPEFSFKADTTPGADALGRFLNRSYFTASQSVTVAGGLAMGANVSARGTFTFEGATVSGVDLATGFGKPLDQFSDSVLSADLKAQLTLLGLSADGAYINDVSMSAFKVSTTGAEGFIGETGISLTSGFGAQSRTGFLLESLNLGVVIMTPTWTVSAAVPSMSFAAAKATSTVKAVGFGGLMDFTAQSAILKVNIGSRFSPTLEQTVVDFAKSFETTAGAANGSYAVGTGIQLDFSGQRKIEVGLAGASATILDILDVRGDFVYEIGARKTVTVQTNVPANLTGLPGYYDATLKPFVDAGLTVTGNNVGLGGLAVNTYRLSAISVSGFMGLGDPTFNPTTRGITNPEDLAGFGFTNLNLDIGLFTPVSSAIAKLGMPDFVALKGSVASATTYGLDGVLEISAQDVTLAINTAARLKVGLSIPSLELPSFSLPTIQLPSILLPDLSLPSISLPNISLPSITVTLPSITLNVPSVEIPNFALPNISLPNLQIPTIDLPAVNLPTIDLSGLIPDLALPSLNLPSITLPSLTLPTIDLSGLMAYLPNPSLPSLTLPKLVLPDLILPSIRIPDLIPTLDISVPSLPRIVFPTITLPTLQLPSLILPDLDLSAFGLPKLKLPNLALPSITLPSFTLPAINLPSLNINAPDFQAWLNLHPDLRLPVVRLPDLNLPAFDLPDLTLPNLDLSVFKIFDLLFPTIPSLPGINLPSLTLPQLTLPTITFPSLQFPSIDFSGIKLPSLAIPAFSLPSISVPQITFPSLQLPRLYVPEFDLTRIKLPTIALPSLSLPTITLPTLVLPKFDITFPQMPTLQLPELQLPSISLPNLQLPSIDLPDIDLSRLSLPGLPKIVLPKIELPWISLPDIQLPNLRLPDLKLPDISIPDFDLPGLKLTKVGKPAIDFQSSFGASGLSVGSSALNFDGNRRTTVIVNQVDMRLASALSLSGAVAFEFGPRVTVNVATGLPASLGAATSTLRPLFNELSTELGLTIGTNFSTISGLEVETMTVGAANLNGFLGYGNPNLRTSLTGQDLTGFGLQNVNFGLAIFKSTLPIKKLPSFTVLKATAGSFTTHGMDGLLNLQGQGISIEVNTGTKWPANLGTPTIDFTTSFPANGSTPAGFAVTMPAAAAPIYLDFNGKPLVALGIQTATINVADFIVLKGGIRVEMGPTYIVNVATGLPANLGAALGAVGLDTLANQLTSIGGVTVGSNFSTIKGLEVSSMTVGGTNISAFVGTPNYDFARPLADQDVFGFKLDGLTFGLGLFKPNLPIQNLPKFTALTASADTFQFKGGSSSVISLVGREITLNLNTGTQWPGGIGTPAIDFQSSFETTPGARNGRFAVPTATSTPVYLSYDGNARIGASVAKATLQTANFVHLSGAFNFEMGPLLEVPLIAGLAGSVSNLVPAEFGGTGNKQVRTLTLGGTGITAFVGLNGPYWQDADSDWVVDRDANGNIIPAETNTRATGLVIDNLSFGLFYGKPSNPLDPVRYAGLKAAAQSVKLIGVEGVTAAANGIQIEVNLSTPTVSILPVLPVINFSGLAGGKYAVKTGAKDASGKDITVDLAMSTPLVRAQGFVSLNLYNSVYVTGSVAFELGPTQTVTLSGGGGTKTVSTMSIGIANANAFIGANGPYWTDTNGNKSVDASELSSTAIGFSVTDFDAGMLVMVSTNPNDLGAYVGLKASVTQFGLVNIPAGITATGMFDVSINVGTTVTTAVDFAASFPATTTPVKAAGYLVNTGDASSPVLLNFTGPQISFQLGGELGVAGIFGINGTLLFDFNPSGLKVLADGRVTLAAGNFFDLRGVGVLVINSAGVAADIDVSIAASVPGVSITAGARLIFNVTGADQTISIPQKYVANLNATTQARLQTDGSGNKYYSVTAGAPLFDGTTGPAEPYVVVKVQGTLVAANTLSLNGDFQIIISASQVSLRVKAAASLSGAAAINVTGGISVTSAGLVGIVQAGLDTGTTLASGTGFNLTLITSFEINTTANAVTQIAGIQLQSSLPGTTVRAGGLGKMRFTLSSVAEFALEGNFFVTAGATDSGISQSITFSGVLSASVGTVTLLKINASGALATYLDSSPGIAGAIQVATNGDSQMGGSGFKFDGTFSFFVNTTTVARTIGSLNVAAGPSVRLLIDGYMQLMVGGVEAFKLGRGTFSLEAGTDGFLVTIDADVPIRVGAITLFTLHTTGALLINGQGLAAKLVLTPLNPNSLAGAGFRFGPSTSFTLEINTTTSAFSVVTAAAPAPTVAASARSAGEPPRAAATVISIPAGPYVQIRAQGSLYVGVSGALEMEMAGTVILKVSSAGLALTANGNLNLRVAGATLITFTLNNGALLINSNGIAAKAALGAAISNVPGLSFSGNFVWELNTTGSAVAVINDTSVNLPAGPYVRVAGYGTLTVGGFVPLNGGFDFSLASDHVELRLNASISIFSSTLSIVTTGGIYADGVAFSVSIGTKIDLVSSISFSGTFQVRVNTTGSSHFGVAANTVEIRVDNLSADFLGLSASGSLVIKVTNGSFTFSIPSSNPLRLSFFGLATVDFSGYFNSLADWSFTGGFGFGIDIGIASASFTASVTISSGNPFKFRFDAEFYGEVLGGLASFRLTGYIQVGGGDDGWLRLGGSVEVTLDFFFFDISFDVPFEFSIGRLSISLPPVLGHVEADGTLVLHAGVDAGLRLRSTNDDDENFSVEHVGGVDGNEIVRVTALGTTQEFSNVRRVVARDTGNGSDRIDIKAGVLADAELNGGVGSDTLTYSGSGTAILRGGSGNDQLTGSAGNDILEGGDDVDRLFGNGGNDVLRGGNHGDYLSGGDGSDVLIGGAGDDSLDGGLGNDIYYFGPGFGRDGLRETANGGTDQINFSYGENGPVNAALTFSFSGARTTVTDGSNTLTHEGNFVEQVIGGAANDTFTFADNVTIAGYVHGGSGGSDILDLGAYSNSLTWDVRPNSVGAGTNLNEGFVSRPGVFSLPFESIENLISGSSHDTFVFANNTGLSGSIDARGGIDRFHFSAYTANGLRVNIGDTMVAGVAPFSASNVAGGTSGRLYNFEHITGGGGNDVLVGNSSNNYSGGNNGRNVLIGNGGNDSLYGLGGSDILIGDSATVAIAADGTLSSIASTSVSSGGNDYLDGGTGDDYIVGGFGADTLFGGSGNDTLFGDNAQITFVSGLPSVAATTSDTVGANDSLSGDDGDDLLVGGLGVDTITGGNSSDQILGDGGSATFNTATHFITILQTTTAGSGGADVIDAGAGHNVVIGGAGADSITTGSGDDIAIGDLGRVDFTSAGLLTSVSTTDSTVGGNDILSLGAGANVAFGGAGNDLITSGDDRDILVGDNGSATFNPAALVLINIRTANPSDAGADTINAGNGNNVVLGGTGNDTITTGVGADVIVGDNGEANFYADTGILQNITTNTPTALGNDIINAGTGPDVIFGGSGDDQIDSGSVSAGDNSRDIVVGDHGRATFDTLGRLTFVTTSEPATGGSDTITLGGGDNVAFGGAGADTITAGNGHDIAVGDSGNATFHATSLVVIDVRTTDAALAGVDTLTLGDGNNIVLGGGAADSLTTGSGNDIALGDNGRVTFDSAGFITFATTTDSAVGAGDTVSLGAGNNIAFGGAGNDNITTDDGRDILVGDNGNATFDASSHLLIDVRTSEPADAGLDTISAGNGNNIVFGGSFSDLITTGTGRDVIVGDNGEAAFDAAAGVLISITTTAPEQAIGTGRTVNGVVYDDVIDAGAGNNVILGGSGGDSITTLGDDDIIVGDNGSATFDTTRVLRTVQTSDPTYAGADTITAGNGNNIVFGGTANDSITTGTGADAIVGDNGKATFDVAGVLRTIETGDYASSGDDTINAGTGADVVFGGSGKDTIDAGSIAAGDVSRDIVVGDNGQATFDSAGRLTSVATTSPETGGNDSITLGAGDNVAFGGVGDDTLTAGDGHDLLVGDNGSAKFDATTPNATTLFVVEVRTASSANAGTDTITAANGDNIVFGGSFSDLITTGTGRDVIVGDNGEATFDAATGVLISITTTVPEQAIGSGRTVDGVVYDDVIDAGAGNNLVFGGSGGDSITTLGDDDIIVGDNGSATFDTTRVLRTVQTSDPTYAGADTITAGNGNNVVFGGTANDTIATGTGADRIVGDNGKASFDAVGALRRIETTDAGSSGNDTITAGDGNNLIMGGSGADGITTGTGDDIVLGDNGYVDYVVRDGNPADLDVVASTDVDVGGVDTITTGAGSDIVIGGAAGDIIDAGTGSNIVFGDNARITAAIADAPNFSTQPFTIGRLETLAPGIGGDDKITTGIGRDILFGGTGADTIVANFGETSAAPDAANIVLGDDGYIDYVRAERPDSGLGADTNSADVDVIASIDFADGGIDTITTGAANDIIIGGQAGDIIVAGDGNNIVIGDSGLITAATEDVNRFAGQSITLGRIETVSFGIGGSDTITTGAGNDVVLGGHNDPDTVTTSSGITVVTVRPDVINAGNGDNLVLGDDGAIDYVRRERETVGTVPGADTDAVDIDLITSLSTTLYGGVDQITTGSGNDIVIGGRFGDTIIAGDGNNIVIGDSGQITAADTDNSRFGTQAVTVYRIETMTPKDGGDDNVTTDAGRDFIFGGFAKDTITAGDGHDVVLGDNGYADFLINDGNPATLDVVRSTDPLLGGNDVIKAGGGDDIVFGGTGNDEIRGEAGYDILLGDHGLVDYSRAANQIFLSIYTGATEGGGTDTIYGGSEDDFILGQQGDDTIYGGAGQDDITGGHNVLSGSDGNDTIYGGDKPGSPLTDLSLEAFTTQGDGADVILGDNALVTRDVLPGTNLWRTYPAPFPDVIRTITLFDDIDFIQGNDSIYGDDGQDIIHGQRGNDILNGGAGDDEVTGELGTDIVVGGAGNDILIGDVGHILRAFNPAGLPIVNANGSWHRDIILTDVGVIIGVIDLDVTPLRDLDPALAAKLLQADVLLLGGTYLPGGTREINSDTGTWATKLYLIDIVDANDDTLRGGDGEDLLFGQRGNDQLEGGAGNDSLFGDGFTNTLPFFSNLPQVVNGIRLIGQAPGSNALVQLPQGGALVIPNLSLRPEEFSSFLPDLTFVPTTVPTFAQAAVNDSLIGTNGSAFVPFASIIPDVVHHVSMLPGNDRLDGGAGDDLLVGDDTTIYSPLFTGLEEIEALTVEVRAHLLWLNRGLHFLSLDEQQLASQRGQPTGPRNISLGNDNLSGGQGDDTIIGDEMMFVAPFMVGYPGTESSFQQAALEYQRFLFDFRQVVVDFSFVVTEAHIQVLQGLVSDLPVTNPQNRSVTKSNAVDPHIHTLSIGNDSIDGGAGNDILVGDDSSYFAPVLDHLSYDNDDVYGPISKTTWNATRSALAAAAKAAQAALGAHVDTNHADPSDRLPTDSQRRLLPWDWEYSLSTSNDTIRGGLGDDLIVGDFAGFVTPVVLSVPTSKHDDWRHWDGDYNNAFNLYYYRGEGNGHHFGLDYFDYNFDKSGFDRVYWHGHGDDDNIFHRGDRDAVRLVNAGNDILRGDDGSDYILADNLGLVVGFVANSPATSFKLAPFDFGHNDYFNGGHDDHHDNGHLGYWGFFESGHFWRNYGLFYGHEFGDDNFGFDGRENSHWGYYRVTGDQGRDNVDGGLGNDILFGDKRSDVLGGGGGTDSIGRENDSRPKDSALDKLRDRFFQGIAPQLERLLLDIAATNGRIKASGDVLAITTNGTAGTVFGLPVNPAAVAAIQGSVAAVRGEPLSFAATLGGQALTTSAASTWNTTNTHGLVTNSGAVAQWKVVDSTGKIVAVGAGASFNFMPTAAGTYTVHFGVADGQGRASVTTAQLVVANYQVRADPASPGGQVLVVGGTTGRDDIELKQQGSAPGSVSLVIDFRENQGPRLSASFTGITRIVVFAGFGNDEVTLESRITLPTELHGGAGNDKLTGGGGNDIIFGETGNDTISGGNGNDVLIGGNGYDSIKGGAGGDILIGGLGVDDLDGEDGSDILMGGFTTWDTAPTGLAAIRATWSSGATFAANAAVLRSSNLAPARVLDDTMKDELKGSNQSDWFIADRDGTGADDDIIKDLRSEDKVDPI
jgi:Ca2+-binding RTX toxin-like protein